MNKEITTLEAACHRHLLHTKWLIAPSYRVGHQWIEQLVRAGPPMVNLHPTTLLRLALEIVGAELIRDGLALASPSVGPLVVDATWERLRPDGYLGRLDRSAELSSSVYQSLSALRLAGFGHRTIETSHLESEDKAEDIELLLRAYEGFLETHRLVDEAEVLRRAVATLESDAKSLGDDAVVLLPVGLLVAGRERRFIDALPADRRIEIRHPAEPLELPEPTTDVRLLADIGRNADDGRPPGNDGSVTFFRAVGEINEVREVLRRALAEQRPLDEIEILHTDPETYVPLILATARRHFSEPDRPDGLPISFAEGIPAGWSRPGRALIAWLRWIEEGFPQRLLVEMIGEGLLDCVEDEDVSFTYLARLLRPVGIGLGAENYLPKLDQGIGTMGKLPPKVSDKCDDDTRVAGAHARKVKGYRTLRRLTNRLLGLSRNVISPDGATVLNAARDFLNTAARSVSELDRYAAEALVERIEDHGIWLGRLGLSLDLTKWLAALPARTRVLGSGPRPGHVHVAHVGSGGHSGRPRTFVVGLDDRRFPGAALQDPVLLDRERSRLSPELATSAARLRSKVDELAATLSRLGGLVTLSWSCHDLVDDRETFPSSVVLSAFRRINGRRDADLESLNEATTPPASFTPTTDDKSLDRSELWLWRLGDDAAGGTNRVSRVEAFFPHLARGSAARLERRTGFGSFNGYVPRAGELLNPFADDGPVLSASALETAGRCPLAFFFRNGLALYPPEELEIDPDRWIDAAGFGSLLHEVFRCFMHELAATGRRPDFERDHRRLAEILGETVRRWREQVPPPNENAFRMQYWQLVRTSRIFLQAEEEFCRTSQPRFFEVARGLDSVGDGGPLDDREPTVVPLPGGKAIRARGLVDRVDQSDSGRYAVWDYKIGSGFGYERVDPFRQGRRVQSVLYLRMIETAVREKLDPEGIVERFGYFFPSIRAHGLRIDWDAETLTSGLETLDRICSGMEAGAFPATDDANDCRYCDYASICRDVEQVTAHSRSLLEGDDVVPLRHYRELRRG